LSHLPPPSIRMEILSRADLLAPVRAMLTSFSERSGFDEIETGHLALAVDEALANVIRHGYDSRPDGRIWISTYLIEEPERRIRIEIEDEGRQTDPDQIVSRDLADVRPGGLGVHLMRNVTDTCEFERRMPGGMRLVLEKTIRREEDRPSDQNHAGTPENGSQ
jgi:serine/threonine-protein kinase RsbW